MVATHATLWRCSKHIQLGGDYEADPEFAGGITYPIWSRNASGSPRKSKRPGRSTYGLLCLPSRKSMLDPRWPVESGWTDYGASRQIHLHEVNEMNRAKLPLTWHIVQQVLTLTRILVCGLSSNLNWFFCGKLQWLVKWESIVTVGPILQKVYLLKFCMYCLHLH